MDEVNLIPPSARAANETLTEEQILKLSAEMSILDKFSKEMDDMLELHNFLPFVIAITFFLGAFSASTEVEIDPHKFLKNSGLE